MAPSDIAKLFQGLQLSDKTSVQQSGQRENYIIDVAAQPSSHPSPLVAAANSNHSIRLFTKSNLSPVCTIKGHTKAVTGLCFGRREPALLYSSSTDKTIRCWDTRTDMKHAVQIFVGSQYCNNLFNCLDVNISDQLLCSGVQVNTKREDSIVLFWDRRKAALLGCYSESHDEDISQVCFHPKLKDRLATGSTDGLICEFDLSQSSEDDALLNTFNTQSSVAHLCWCGEKFQDVACCTHNLTYHRWNTEEGDSVFEVLDLKERVKTPMDYVINNINTDTGDLYLVTGAFNGDANIIDVQSEDNITMVMQLSGGHNSTIRRVLWDQKAETLVSGGEDSLICLWSTKQQEVNKVKLSAKKNGVTRKRPY